MTIDDVILIIGEARLRGETKVSFLNDKTIPHLHAQLFDMGYNVSATTGGKVPYHFTDPTYIEIKL